MTRYGLLIHAADSHLRQPKAVLAPEKGQAALTRTSVISITGGISTIEPATTSYNAAGSADAAAIDGASEASNHKTP